MDVAKNHASRRDHDIASRLDKAHQLTLGCLSCTFNVATVAAAPSFIKKDDADVLFRRIRRPLSKLALGWLTYEIIPSDTWKRFAQSDNGITSICGVAGPSAHKAVVLLGQQTLLPFFAALEEIRPSLLKSYQPPEFDNEALTLFANFLPFLRVIWELCSTVQIAKNAENILVEQFSCIAGHLSFLSPLVVLDNNPMLDILAKLDREYSIAADLLDDAEIKPGTSADKKADKVEKKLPTKPDVRDLCQLLQKELPKGRNAIEIAREFTGSNDTKAKNLLRQARRYRYLWE